MPNEGDDNTVSRLLIIEPNASGHRMNYVRIVAKEALRRNIQVTVATFAKSLTHASYQVIAEELREQYREEIIAIPENLETALFGQSEYRRHWAYHRLFQQWLQNSPEGERPDAIFVPYLNICDKAIAVFGSPFGNCAWSGLVMRDTFHHATMGVLSPAAKSDKMKERLFRRLLKNSTLTALFSIDDVLAEYVQQHLPRLRGKFHYAADPVQMQGTVSRKEARKRFGIPENVPVILVYGAMTGRKGILELLQATESQAFPGNVSLLLAGEQDAEAREILAGAIANKLRTQNRLVEAAEYLDDAAEYAAFQASDIVWVGYRQHYVSSGVILQSAAMGLPVLSCEEGLLGWRTQKYRIGLSVDVTDAEAVATATQKLLCDDSLRAQCNTNGLKLAHLHNAQAFGETILSALFPMSQK